MHEILWAIGSSVVLFILVIFLPLGLTYKGRFSIVITAFFLAVLGQAAVRTFPLWQTVLILVLLIIFSSYIMHNRLGFILLNQNIESKEKFILETEKLELEDEIKDFNNSYIESRKNPFINYEGDILETAKSLNIDESEIELDKNIGKVTNEDISFLLDQTEYSDIKEETELEKVELGYLADIESMLTEEAVIKQTVKEEANWLDELEELIPSFEEGKALKEAATSIDKNEKEMVKINE